MSEINPVKRVEKPEGVGSRKREEIVVKTREDHINDVQRNLALINSRLAGDLPDKEKADLQLRKQKLELRLEKLTGGVK
jgi:hypothetical protein